MSNNIYVWDRFVRIFHWSLLVLFVTSYLTGEEEHWVHPYSGYAILTLLALRVLWGFIGTRYARFTDFVYSPAKVLGYLRGLVTGEKTERYIGHNPAGGMMVLAMLLTLSCIGFSGLKFYALEEGKGPFAGDFSFTTFGQAYADADNREGYYGDYDDEDERQGDYEDEESEEYWEEIHEASVNFMILLIILHVVGVFVSGRRHNESLVNSMLTGYKKRKV